MPYGGVARPRGIDMAVEKLVDGEFLGKLLGGSFEVAMGAVEEAVAGSSALFGGDDETEVRVIGTYPDHAVVANRAGDFYRCEWSNSGGEIELKNIRQIDVPIIEGEVRQSAIRRKYEEAVKNLLECKTDEAEEKLRELLDLANGGVPMTVEAVEYVFSENKARFAEADWVQMITEKESEIRRFIGADSLRLSYPKVRFEHLTGESIDESVAEAKRADVIESIKGIQSFLAGLHAQTELARQVDEGHVVRGSADDTETVADFVQFASGFAEDLDGMISIVDDALAVSEDGCVKCLARLHDGIAVQMKEWAIAATFAEKMAHRFESTTKAA